ncbi:ankyrin repeat-containing domain protein [Hypoxylon rubiginosum]|uniref:Ankyrin repeat-containing domain protein n=1 Tax=Hypoxylon rubiginosum TaxID=110542 RepID=A0ACC0CWQ6_9PEZI|nr:ankyrin repeat-containing domain protein [Hypoxylon rubiginosum]
MPPTLFTLPTELLYQVAENLENPDLVSFSTTCRFIHSIADTVLYRLAANRLPYLLPWACEARQIVVVQKLLTAGASPNTPHRLPQSRLCHLHGHNADSGTYSEKQLEKRKLDDPMSLLSKVYYPRSRPKSTLKNTDYNPERLETYSPARCYWFPIHAAAKAGCDEIIKLLVKHGSYLDPPSVGFCWCPRFLKKDNDIGHGPFKWTPLHAALCSRNEDTAQLLISLGASLSVDFSDSPTVLHSAAAHGCVSILNHQSTEPSFDANTKDKYGLTPLAHARGRRLERQTSSWLVAHGADVNTVLGLDGWTLLHSTLDGERYHDAAKLIDSGADIHAVVTFDEGGFGDYRPITFPCRRKFEWSEFGWSEFELRLSQGGEEERTKLVEKLIKLGASVETRHDRINQPLIVASMSHFLPIIKLLVAAGADICGEDGFGYFPLMAAVDMLPEEPMGAGSDDDDLRLETVIWLLDHGANINQVSPVGETPLKALCSAVFIGPLQSRLQARLARLLLERGADPNISDQSGSTALKRALEYGHKDIIQDLLKYGARGYAEYANR